MNIASVRLAPGRDQALGRRHPWIFSGALHRATPLPEEGSWVHVFGSDGTTPLATAHAQANGANIALKVLAFGEHVADPQTFYDQRIQRAVDYRSHWGLGQSEHTTGYRLVFGEGDSLPGLVVDRYGQAVVVQCHTEGMRKDVPFIVSALRKALKASDLSIYVQEVGWDGAPLASVGFLENGVAYTSDVEGGQKTGFFLDQREHRAHVGRLAQGKKVVNLFAYTGGFSLAALQGGAREVVSVDSSARACALADAHAALNGWSDRHLSVVEDAFDYLKHLPTDADVVILDPPAFAKRKSSSHNAMMAYKRLNAMALERMPSGSLLFTFSCSQNVPISQFTDAVRAAAYEVGREIRLVETLGQPIDHPVIAGFAEGAYLKGLLVYVD
jgi:23S rRNA (cytosine1962-C5)-methyltransferase